MKVAMEIPLAHLEELSEYCDYDFSFAHLLLKWGPNSPYAKFYRKQREKGREVWLDNGFHELGYSLPLEDLLKAAKMIHPTYFVAAEIAKDPIKTHAHVLEAAKEIARRKLPYKLVGTWQGSKRGLDLLEEICDLVALPFRRPRQTVLTSKNSWRYHFFGIRTLDEIRRTPPRSIDTSAPIKYALYGQDMEARERRLRSPLLDYNTKLSDLMLTQVVRNIALLKSAAKPRTWLSLGTLLRSCSLGRGTSSCMPT